MRLGPLFRGTFEVQAGNRPLQGQSKPPVFTGGFDYCSVKKLMIFVRHLVLALVPALVLVPVLAPSEELR